MSRPRSWIVGSDPGCDVVVTAQTVSRRHCRLTERDGGFLVEDLGSSNGTYVDGRRIAAPTWVGRAGSVTLGLTVPLPWPRVAARPAEEVIRIGRDPGNDLVMDAPGVSAFHARLVLADGRLTIEDLGSTNGTFRNGPDQRITAPTPLAPADVILFGSHAVPVARLLAGRSDGAPRSGQSIDLGGQSMTFGRDAGCDQVLDFPMISGRHARLWRSGSSLYVEDLGSSNGTFVNGHRIGRRPFAVRPGDVIGLGSYSFTVTDEGHVRRRDARGHVAVQARGVGASVGGKALLEGVSFTVRPAEFVALMGPSGAGKTTLLKTLVGYLPPSRGAVLLNGVDLYRAYGAYRGHIGYVPQEDIIHQDLTVRQALRFSARLRLPADFRDSEIDERIRRVLEELGLVGTEDVLIGSPTRSGISGGQRKRVNLAMELLTDPSVLFLDEPTSGLSSDDTLQVMRLLRRLADGGKTILLTIHQPSLDAYRLLDNLAVIARDKGGAEPGRLAYYGPAYPGALEFFNDGAQAGREPSPDEVLENLKSRPAAEWVDRYRASPVYREFVEDRTHDSDGQPDALPPAASRGGRGLSQAWTLARRAVAIKARDLGNTATLLLQAPITAALIVLVFQKKATMEVTPASFGDATRGISSTAFVLGLTAIWFGCSNAIREIVGEWSVYHRERMINLRLLPYVASKLGVLGLLGVFQCAVLLSIVAWGNGLEAPWGPTYGLLLLAALVGTAIGLAVSALARTTEMAIGVLPLIIIPQLLLGGMLQPLPELPAPVRVVANALPSRWVFEGLLTLEADAQPTARPQPAPGAPAGELRDMAETHFPIAGWRRGPRAASYALLGMLGVGVGGVLVILRARDLH